MVTDSGGKSDEGWRADDGPGTGPSARRYSAWLWAWRSARQRGCTRACNAIATRLHARLQPALQSGCTRHDRTLFAALQRMALGLALGLALRATALHPPRYSAPPDSRQLPAAAVAPASPVRDRDPTPARPACDPGRTTARPLDWRSKQPIRVVR